MVQEHDQEPLKYLIDIRWARLGEDKLGFALEFHFSPNPFFEETVLRKEYHEVETSSGVEYDHVQP